MLNLKAYFSSVFSSLLLVWSLLYFIPTPLSAWDKDLIKAAEAVRKGTNSDYQLGMVLSRNYEINLLAMKGKINNTTFQKCQHMFVVLSTEIGRRQANRIGVDFNVQVSTSKKYKPGTDSDYITGATEPDQVKKMQEGYNEDFTVEMKKLGIDVSDNTNWVESNDIDLMADASKTTTENFNKIAELNNAAYKRPGSARYEAYSRSSENRGPPNIQDSIDYIDEMQDMIHHRDKLLHGLRSEFDLVMYEMSQMNKNDSGYSALRNKAEALDTEIFKQQALQAKYMDRINIANDNLKILLPPDSPLRHDDAFKLPIDYTDKKEIEKASKRNIQDNPLDARALGAMKNEIVDQQMQKHIEILVAVVEHNPESKTVINDAIKKYASKLDQKQKKEILQTIKEKLSLSEIDKEFKELKKIIDTDQGIKIDDGDEGTKPLPAGDGDKKAALLLKKVSDNPKAVKLWTGIIYQRALTAYNNPQEAIDGLNGVLDVLDNHTVEKLRANMTGVKFNVNGKIVSVSIGSINNYLNGTILGSIGNNAAYKNINLALEGKAYYDAVMNANTWSQGFINLGYELMSRRLPGYAAAGAWENGNYGRLAIELSYLAFPLIAIPEGLYGMAQGATEWGVGKLNEWEYNELVDGLYESASFEKRGSKWYMTGLKYQCPNPKKIISLTVNNSNIVQKGKLYGLLSSCPHVRSILYPKIHSHPAITQLEDMLDNKKVSSGKPVLFGIGAGWPYSYMNLSKYGKKLEKIYLKKVDDVTLEYFKGVIEGLEKRKDWETGTGYAKIIKLEKKLDCKNPLIEYTKAVSITGHIMGGDDLKEDIKKDAERFQEVIDAYAKLKESNKKIMELKKKWKAEFLREKKPYCSIKSIKETEKNTAKLFSDLINTVNASRVYVEKYVNAKPTVEDLQPLTRAKLCMIYFKRQKSETEKRNYERCYWENIELKNKYKDEIGRFEAKINILPDETKFCIGEKVTLSVDYNMRRDNSEVSWKILNEEGKVEEKLKSVIKTTWKPKSEGMKQIQANVKVSYMPEDSILKSKRKVERKIIIKPESECSKLQVALDANGITEIMKDAQATITAKILSFAPGNVPVTRYFWFEDGKKMDPSETPTYTIRGNKKGNRIVNIEVITRDKNGNLSEKASIKIHIKDKVSKSLYMKIISPERKVIGKGSITIKDNETILLKAIVNPKPDSGKLKYRWSANKKKVFGDDGDKAHFKGTGWSGKKVIVDVIVMDEKQREGVSSIMLEVEPSTGLSVELEEHKSVVTERDTLKLRVKEAKQNNKKYHYTWKRDGKVVVDKMEFDYFDISDFQGLEGKSVKFTVEVFDNGWKIGTAETIIKVVKSIADSLIEEGKKLVEEDRLKEALKKFEESLKYEPNQQIEDYIEKIKEEISLGEVEDTGTEDTNQELTESKNNDTIEQGWLAKIEEAHSKKDWKKLKNLYYKLRDVNAEKNPSTNSQEESYKFHRTYLKPYELLRKYLVASSQNKFDWFRKSVRKYLDGLNSVSDSKYEALKQTLMQMPDYERETLAREKDLQFINTTWHNGCLNEAKYKYGELANSLRMADFHYDHIKNMQAGLSEKTLQSEPIEMTSVKILELIENFLTEYNIPDNLKISVMYSSPCIKDSIIKKEKIESKLSGLPHQVYYGTTHTIDANDNTVIDQGEEIVCDPHEENGAGAWIPSAGDQEDLPLPPWCHRVKKKISTYEYVWQPVGGSGLEFDPPNGKEAQVSVTFGNIGEIEIWAEVQKDGELVGETEPIKTKAIPPNITLSFEPEALYVGDEGRAIITLEPNIQDKFTSFSWLPMGANAQKLIESNNGRSTTFKLKNIKPATIEVLVRAKSPYYGGQIGSVKQIISAKPYKVDVNVLGSLGPKPKIWKEGKGLVEVDKEIAIHQNVRLVAQITPVPKNTDLRYAWKLNEDSHFAGGESGKEVMLNRSQTGTCIATVTIKDKDGNVLGKGSGSFSVTISQKQLDGGKEKAEDQNKQNKAKELLQEARKLWKEGKLDQAIAKVAQAQKLAGKDKDIAKTLKAMQRQKKDLDTKLKEAEGFISKGKFKEAKKVLDNAARINDKYKKYNEVLKQLTDAKKKAEEKKKQVAKLLKDTKALKDAGKLDEAVAILKKGSKLFPGNKEIDKLLKEVQKQQNDAHKKMTEGQGQWKNGMLDKAVATLQEAVKIDPLNKKIAKVLKGMQSQKKMIDDILMEADKLIEQKKFDEVKSILKKAERISSKYPPYVEMLKNLDFKKKKAEEEKNAAEKFKHETLKEEREKALEKQKTLQEEADRIEAEKRKKERVAKAAQAILKKVEDKKKAEHENMIKIQNIKSKENVQSSAPYTPPSNISSILGSWSFGRSKHYGKPVEEHICDLTLTDNLTEGIGYKINSCHSNESYWILEGKILLFIALDGTVTTRFTEVKPNYWEGTYVGSSHSGEGVVHYLKKSEKKVDATESIGQESASGTSHITTKTEQTIEAKYGPPPSANTWKHYSIPLTAYNFGVDTQTFKQVLANVSSFRIRTEMHNGNDVGGIDTVKIANIYLSDFNGGTGGWNAAGDGTMEWVSSGGNSGGYLQISDWASGDWHWAVAPSSWSGNWQELIGSSIDFFYKTDHPSYGAVVEISSKQQNRLGVIVEPLVILQGSDARVSISPYPISSKDISISLTSSDSKCMTVPKTVLIPAGQTKVETRVNAVKSTGACDSVITVSASGYGESRITLSVKEKVPAIDNNTVQSVIVSGKTKTSTTYTPNTKGDVFNGGHWAGSSGRSDWLQKDFSSSQLVTGVYIGRASTDITTKGFRLVLKLKKSDGQWVTIDELHDTNINRTVLSGGAVGRSIPPYTKRLSPAIKATTFRLEFSGNGWFDATDIRIHTSKSSENISPSGLDIEGIDGIVDIDQTIKNNDDTSTGSTKVIHPIPSPSQANTKGYWQLVEEKGSIGRECTPKERYNDYYRDTISGFGSHIKITKMVRKNNQVYCEVEGAWQRPAEKLYPGSTIKLPVTINRLVDTGKYGCKMAVGFDMHDMECGFSGSGEKIGSVTLDRKGPSSIKKTISWKVKEPSRKKKGEKLTIRACYSAQASICGKNRGMKYYYEWMPEDSSLSTLAPGDAEVKKAELAARIRKIREKAAKEQKIKEDEQEKSTEKFMGTLSGSWSGKGTGDWKGWTSNGTFVMNISREGKISGNYSGDDNGKLVGSVSGLGKLNIKSGGGTAGAGTWGGSIKIDSTAKLSGNGFWSVDGFKGTWSGE